MNQRLTEISSGLAAMGLSCSADQAAALLEHLRLVDEANASFNLTTIQPEDAVMMHILDSAVAVPYLEQAPEGGFADLGSGAGFPGVPLAILTGRSVSLVESVKKKAAFLERVVAGLRLKATVHPIRAEELALVRGASYAAVTARALSALPSLVELASPLLQDGGLLVCLKGRPDDEELMRGDAVGRKCGMLRIDTLPVIIPGVDATRTIIVYRREGKSRTILPRRNGLAQRQPLA
jgi:16S rRNA (guanine527-N7)-methyltransferase